MAISVASTTTYDAGLRQYMLGVYNNMGVGLAISGIVSYLVGNVPELTMLFLGGPQVWLFLLAPIALVFYLSANIYEMSVQKATTIFYAYSALMGISLGSIFAIYTASSIFQVFLITASLFGTMSLYGYTTKRDLTNFGSFLIMGVIGIFIAALVNLFLQSGTFSFIISALSVLIFTGLTAYDTQKIKDLYDELPEYQRANAGIFGALNLYIDFINIMVSLLNIIGQRR